jgi:hypothetical protein
MEQSKAKKIILYLLMTVVMIFIVWSGLTVYKTLAFHIISTNPDVGKITIISPFLKIDFNKSLSKSVTITSTPSIINNYEVLGKEITASFAIPLNPKQTYTVFIHNIYDTGGKHLADQKFIFRPKNINLNNLPKDQSQVLLNNQTQYAKTIQNNKLLQLLPFTGPGFEYRVDYTVNYSPQGSEPTIKITAPTPQAQQNALAWIKSQGQNLSSIKIQYINAQP